MEPRPTGHGFPKLSIYEYFEPFRNAIKATCFIDLAEQKIS
jgi:hypothetical protein